MAQKWNLQDIRPVEPRRRSLEPAPVEPLRRPISTNVVDTANSDESDGAIIISDGRTRKRRLLLVAFLIFFGIIGSAITAGIATSGATIVVQPNFFAPNVNASFETFKVATEKQLPYEIMTLEAEGERQVKASGEEAAEVQATGKILIYNKHQTSPVRLVANTRFASPDGLIFRIKDSAVIPGYKEEGGKIIPGVVSAEVFADEVGEKYNLNPTTFTIPGFAGEPEFDNLYGESTESFTGGFSGTRFIIEDTELQTAEQALRTELRNSLLERINAEKPAGFIVYNDAVTFSYVSLPAVAYGDNLATIKEKVIMRLPMFKEDQFARFIAEATIPDYHDEPVRISNPTALTFSYTSATTSASDIGAVTSLSFALTGRPQIVYTFDVGKFKTELLGASKATLTSVLGNYPAISKAEANIRPFWKTTFPRKLDDIEVIEKIE